MVIDAQKEKHVVFPDSHKYFCRMSDFMRHIKTEISVDDPSNVRFLRKKVFLILYRNV